MNFTCSYSQKFRLHSKVEFTDVLLGSDGKAVKTVLVSLGKKSTPSSSGPENIPGNAVRMSNLTGTPLPSGSG